MRPRRPQARPDHRLQIADAARQEAGVHPQLLDLRDLLVGELHTGANAGNLASYLNFTYDATTTTTTVSVKSSSTLTAPDQIILLQGVDLVGTFTSQDAIIADLFTRGKLITD